MPKTTCQNCASSDVSSALPATLSIDCATSAYATVRVELRLCQDCIDLLATSRHMDFSRRILALAADQIIEQLST